MPSEQRRVARPSGILLDDYCRLQRVGPYTPEGVRFFLERHMIRWTTNSPFLADNPTEVCLLAPEDYVAHTVAVPRRVLCWGRSLQPTGRHRERADRVKRLGVIPFFYRLNFIRQLSTTFISANLESGHNRLAHSLGTVDCAAAILEAIEGKGFVVDDRLATAVLLYALLHDCFHGPFGHTLDLLRDVLWSYPEERADKYMLRQALDEAIKRQGAIWKAVCTHLEPNPTAAHDILQRVHHLHTCEEGKRGFASDIVDGAIDADRLDYLWRDGQHLMRPDSWTRDQGTRLLIPEIG